MENPALRQEPRSEPAAVIPIKQRSSLIDWLEANNRIIPREELEEEAKADVMAENEDFELLDPDDRSYSDDFEVSSPAE